jgi:hypothetical protein
MFSCCHQGFSGSVLSMPASAKLGSSTALPAWAPGAGWEAPVTMVGALGAARATGAPASASAGFGLSFSARYGSYFSICSRDGTDL